METIASNEKVDTLSQPIINSQKMTLSASGNGGRGKRMVKGGLGLGKGMAKGGGYRHKHILRNNIEGITKPAIRRLARRGGVKRLSGLVYDTTRDCLVHFLKGVIRDSVTYVEHGKRKTVTCLDVIYALKRAGRTLYGYN